MNIEYDTEKGATNLAKHGVSLALGAIVLENCIGEIIDDRHDYGETRLNAFGPVEGRLFVCTYTVRDEKYRVNSVRRASRQEHRTWPQ
jgi:uncharacterized DUF497 family protein